jgi:chromosome partitioning protein
MVRRIAVLNQKGGVGKTVTTLNLAYALTLKGYRVMAIDMDPQGQLAESLGVRERNRSGIDAVLLEQHPISDLFIEARDRLNLVLAGPRLSEVEHLHEGGASRGRRLQQALTSDVLNEPDYLLIDCPPASGLLMVNALFACDEVLIPVAGEYLALAGLAQLLRTLQSFERMIKQPLQRWLVVTRFRPRGRLSRSVLERLSSGFPGQLLATPIRENIALAESPGFGKSVFEYNSRSLGAADYGSLADDLINKRVYRQ